MSLILFVILSSLCAAALVAVLAHPLWRGSGASARQRLRRTHRRALKQLDRALRADAIDTALHAAQRQHLSAHLAEALAADAGVASRSSTARRWAFGVAITVPLVVGGLYWYVGDWRALAHAPRSEAALPSVEQMVDGLAQRLKANPNDLQGWALLGRSYMVLGRYDGAAQAYEQANRLAGGDPDIQLDYAEALVLQSPQALTDQAAPLIEGGLAASPNNPKALWLGGLLAQAHHDERLAAQRWNALLTQPGLSDETRRAVEQHLQALATSPGTAGSAPAGAAAVTASAAPQASQPANGVQGRRGVEVRVTLAASLSRDLPAGAALFLFARPLGQSAGPPLAVRRLELAALPATVRLTAADAMMAGDALKADMPLQLTARVTLHGGVTGQAGDLEGRANYGGDGKPVTIHIDHVLR